MDVVRSIEVACRVHRYPLILVAPVAVALGYAVQGDDFSWSDGPIRIDIQRDEHGMVAVRRYPSCPSPTTGTLVVVEALAALGDEAPLFAPAYGAAMIPKGEPLVARCGRQIPATVTVPRWRMAAAVIGLALSAFAYFLLPPLSNQRTISVASAQIGAADQEWRAALRAENELRQVTGALSDFSTFISDRRSALGFLSSLSEALPESSVLLTIRADTAGGTLVALAPRAAAVVGAVEDIAEVASVEIAGSVTREAVGEQELERVTLRFWFESDRQPSADAPPVEPQP